MWVGKIVGPIHKRLRKVCMWVCEYIGFELKKTKHSLPEQVVPVSVATTKEQPCLSKCGLRVLLPLLHSESQTSGCE